MQSTQQIIKNTYDTNPKFKEQLDLYGLTLDDVAVKIIPTKEHLIAGDSSKVLTLGYSMEDKKVVSCFTYLAHEKIEESMSYKSN